MFLSLRTELQDARDQLLLKQDMLHVMEVQRVQCERQSQTLVDETEHWKGQCLQTKQDFTEMQGLAAFQHRKIQSQSIAFINLQKRAQALVDSTADMTVQLVLFKCYLDTADKHDKALKAQLDQRHRAVLQLEAGSGVYFQAYVTSETQIEVELKFPACRETNAAEVLLWVSKFSSRIWRGPLSHDAWTNIANGEGAWRPRKKKQAFADRASKDAVPSHDTDVGEMGRKRLSADMLQTNPA
ncbi:hypothetical protein WJX82_006572 [Trebouxia sp. C0006]